MSAENNLMNMLIISNNETKPEQKSTIFRRYNKANSNMSVMPWLLFLFWGCQYTLLPSVACAIYITFLTKYNQRVYL